MANNQSRAKFQEPGHYTDKDREKIPTSDFGDPDARKFPIVTAADVMDAAHLIGKAGDPEAVKRRIIAIAKRKGFPIPDAWKSEDNGRAAQTPTARAEETRVTGATAVENVFTAPITRVDPDKRLVTVTATSEAIDSFGTIFDYDASKKAFQRWVGNIREMHQPKAVGSRVAVHCDDEARKIDVTLRISKGAQDTWEKVLDGTLKGASIGASNVTWVKPTQRDKGGRAVPRAVDYSLAELSLVDNPSNPDAYGIAIMRNAEPDATILDVVSAEDERAETSAERGNILMQPANTNEAPTSHDPFTGGDVDASADPDDALHDAEPEGDANELHTALRPTKLEGAGSVPAGSEDNEHFTEHGGPPADPSDKTFAASRPEGVVGSQVRSGGGAGGRDLAASVAGFAAANGATAAVVDMPTVGSNPLAPFGMGATLPVNRGKLPSRRERQQAERSAKAALEAEVRRAGDQAAAQAEAQYGPWSPTSGLQYGAWQRRIQQARGAAEKAVIERQQARAIAEELAAGGNPNAVVRDAHGLPHHAGSMTTVQALRAQVAEVQAQRQQAPSAADSEATRAEVPASLRERIVREYLASQGQQQQSRAAAPTETRAEAPTSTGEDADESRAMPMGSMENAAIVQTAPAASSAVSEKALLGNGRQAHSHNHAHNGALVHGADGAHSHEHTHLDGTTHSHPHMHAHDHHDHHSEMRAMGAGDGHTHDHQHPHDHMHTYRAGQPTDTALVQAEATRDRNTMGLETLASPASVGSLHPVSGSAQSAHTEKPQSPQMSVHPQSVGHMDLLNTEDANAVGFGVPAEVHPVPTPAGVEITPPVGLHEGGHQGELSTAPLAPANNAFVQAAAPLQTNEIPHGASENQGPMDDDLDHDAEEDAREREAAGAANNPTPPPLPRSDEPEETRAVGADGEDAATAAMTLSEQADDTRVGARVSAESRAALHAARDQMETSYQSLCQHCGCAECTAKLDAMAAAAEAYANPERLAEGADATTLFGQRRLFEAVVTRGLAGFDAQLATTLTQTLSAALTPLLETLQGRLADLELTLADGERSTRATLAEHVRADVADAVSRMSESLAPLAQVGQQLSSVAEVASGLTAAVTRIGEQVEQIAAQPAAVPAMPQQYAAAKRFAAASLDPATTPVGQWSDEQRTLMMQALQAQARATTSPDEQVRLSQLVWQLGVQPKQLMGR